MNPREDVVYGPIDSRRLGQSLGLNLMPAEGKVCTFDCVYCYCGPTKRRIFRTVDVVATVPSMEQIYEGLMEGFTYHLAHRTPIDYITFAGHGEPTLHPAFAEIVDGVLGLRDEYFPGKPTAIFSNASLLHRPEVVAGIAKLDKRIMKFDAADEATFRQIDKPLVDITFAQMVENLRRLDGLILTSGVLASARYSNVESLKSADYIEAIGSIQPLEVHLYSIDHPTGYKGISRVSRELMEDIAQWLHGRTGVMVKVLQNRNPRRHAYVRARHAVD